MTDEAIAKYQITTLAIQKQDSLKSTMVLNKFLY